MPLIGSDKPRQHHYLFGHRFLPAMARTGAERMPELVRSGRLDSMLAQAWNAAGDGLDPSERLAGAGLSASLHELPDGVIVLVTLPSAHHTTEAHFAAVTVVGGQESRFFVLEHSWNLDDTPSTVLGEWTESRHINLGAGPSPPRMRSSHRSSPSLGSCR